MHDGAGPVYDYPGFGPTGADCPPCTADLDPPPPNPFPDGRDGSYYLIRSIDLCDGTGSMGEGLDAPAQRPDPGPASCP
jgi:hypothetical protein